jgi:transposase
MKTKHKNNLIVAAAKAGMSAKTARKYISTGKLPKSGQSDRMHRTRKDPFEIHWKEIESLLEQSSELQAKTILYYLMERYPDVYTESHLRTMQRRLQQYRAEKGKEKPVIFLQDIPPGRMSQSDWTVMDSLGITLAGQPFPHRLFHFMLPYSQWETVMVCRTESFDTLTQGFERAVFQLGGCLREHRTDNLSAATQKMGSTRIFTERWESFLSHYEVKPSRNNPGESHENGSVEKSHDTFKNAVKQHLLLRGSFDFASLSQYEQFLFQIVERRNQSRLIRLNDELPFLKSLPERRWRDPVTFSARVSPSSTIQVLNCTYSVPSRLISYTLKVQVYPDTVELHYGQQKLLTMPRIESGVRIDYRHIIDSLIRKPGAFSHYQYRDSLFPHPLFRKAFDELSAAKPMSGHKDYLKVLQYAKLHGETQVIAALELCHENHLLPESQQIEHYLKAPCLPQVTVQVNEPDLKAYDKLFCSGGILC